MTALHRYITRAQAARALGLSEQTLSGLLDSGRLPCVQMARSSWRRIYTADLETFAQQHGFRLDLSALLD